LNSWDRFIVPWPFARGLFVYGEPIDVPEDTDAAGLEMLGARVERALEELTRQADEGV
jgi:lysophospholipid acyltransferase (LPLAT)-like uncharacterized protein